MTWAAFILAILKVAAAALGIRYQGQLLDAGRAEAERDSLVERQRRAAAADAAADRVRRDPAERDRVLDPYRRD